MTNEQIGRRIKERRNEIGKIRRAGTPEAEDVLNFLGLSANDAEKRKSPVVIDTTGLFPSSLWWR